MIKISSIFSFELIKKCWSTDSQRRPSFEAIIGELAQINLQQQSRKCFNNDSDYDGMSNASYSLDACDTPENGLVSENVPMASSSIEHSATLEKSFHSPEYGSTMFTETYL